MKNRKQKLFFVQSRPVHSRVGSNIELCACGARRWVDQNGAPATPWRSINLGTKPGGNERAGVAPRTYPKSALDGLITCGDCGQS